MSLGDRGTCAYVCMWTTCPVSFHQRVWNRTRYFRVASQRVTHADQHATYFIARVFFAIAVLLRSRAMLRVFSEQACYQRWNATSWNLAAAILLGPNLHGRKTVSQTDPMILSAVLYYSTGAKTRWVGERFSALGAMSDTPGRWVGWMNAARQAP